MFACNFGDFFEIIYYLFKFLIYQEHVSSEANDFSYNKQKICSHTHGVHVHVHNKRSNLMEVTNFLGAPFKSS